MPDSPLTESDFLSQLTAAVEENLADEQFGVSELAERMNMSRSNLLRKVKKHTNLSVSQLIRDVRLQKAMEMLKGGTFNVSEVSHQVGFSSTSYFIKCFREQYGYPPGEVGKREIGAPDSILPPQEEISASPIAARKMNITLVISIAAGVLMIVLASMVYLQWFSRPAASREKSIAVLPFKNDSNDSSNVYLINGLMESTLNNLQTIKDLKVISRTSAEKYRNTLKSIPELARELNVSYVVEGSGQKIGDQIVLNIQLIDAESDRHLWSKQYRRETRDIFELQREIARNIVKEIEVILTPEEVKRIEKNPTDNLEAYDHYLKGKDQILILQQRELLQAAEHFRKAIELDDHFTLAYAHLVIVYYYLDVFQVEKKYTKEINDYADKAMLFDPHLGESLIAKALDYAHQKEYASAVLYLEKALEYHPHSGLVFYFLTEFYSMYVTDLERYLEYSLHAAQIDVISADSAAVSLKYFHVSNSLIQAGFVDESISYLDKSLAYNPNNYFASYAGILFRFAQNHNARLTRDLLITEFERGPGRLDIAKEIAKVSYLMEDYESAYKYYSIFLTLREQFQMEIFKEDFLGAGIVFLKMGKKKEGEAYIKAYKEYADETKTIYRHLYLGLYYVYVGDDQKAIEHFALFAKEDNYVYWALMMEHDPTMHDLKKRNPAFQKVMNDIKAKFWKRHDQIKTTMIEKGLM